jgi:hypothetical protein
MVNGESIDHSPLTIDDKNRNYAQELFQDRFSQPMAAPGILLYQYHGFDNRPYSLFPDILICALRAEL